MIMNQINDWSKLFTAIERTFLMVFVSTIIAFIIGLPIGILLYHTSKKGLKPNRWVNLIVGTIVNIFRSIPCLLLIIMLKPFSISILGLFGGTWTNEWYSMVIPLVVASFGFIARMVEQSLSEIDGGVIEAAKAMGTPTFKIITDVLLKEAGPSLISGFAVAVVSIVGYTSFAGYIGAGGLIAQGFSFGYTGNNREMMWICVICIIIFVQIIQEGGLYLAKLFDKRRK